MSVPGRDRTWALKSAVLPSLAALALALSATSVGGCRTPATPEQSALAVVAAARSPSGIGPERVDAQLVEQVRCLQLVRRAALDTHDRDKLLAALAGEAGPDRQYPVAERAQKQRERATRGLKASLTGTCGATVDAAALGERVEALAGPIVGAPAEVATAQAAVRQKLAAGRLVRVTCDSGEVALLLVPGRSVYAPWLVVDAFTIGAAPVEVDPSSPGMK